GRLQELEVSLDEERSLLLSSSEDGAFTARVEQEPLERRTLRYDVVIRRSLYQDAVAAGLPAALVLTLAETYSCVLDFNTELAPGDRVSVLAEAFYRRGNFVRTGSILAAAIRSGGRVFPAYRFRDQYYDEDGQGLLRALLRSPLVEYRVTSGFSPWRLHPILGTRRPHYGVDLAAPT